MKARGGRPRTFTLPERREIKKIAKSKPAERIKTWKSSKDPDHEAKKARAGHLYAIADGEVGIKCRTWWGW